MSANPESNNVTPIEGHGKPEAKIIFVDPTMAARWLEKNPRNRRIRPDTVKKYARDMEADRWQISGEAIKFAPDGTLLDGQHRLAAIISSGATVPLLVVRGIAPEAQRVMDTGRSRTASDALSIRGERHTSVLAASARLALGFDADAPNPTNYEATHGEIERFVDLNPGLRAAAEFASQVARRTDCPPTMVAYSFWRMAQLDRDDAVAFWVAAADKVGLSAGDPVIAMTNRFAEARRNRERLSKRAYASVIFRCWNYRRSNKTLRLVKINSPAGGLIPIPEPR